MTQVSQNNSRRIIIDSLESHLACRIVDDALESALEHLEGRSFERNIDGNKNDDNDDDDDSGLLDSMETVVVTPVRKSSLSSFQNRQLKDGRKRSVTFNTHLIQEYIIEDGKANKDKPAQDPENQENNKSDGNPDDDEEITKL